MPTPKLFDIAAASEARRSLFFIDACRERITGDARSGATLATAAPLVSRMGRVNGQVVFYAAAAGGYAYDADGNGVFTKAVLEGLSCKAALAHGAVTAETLRTFVEHYVRNWIRQYRNSGIRAATQVSMDGDSWNMPLSVCAGTPPPPPAGNIVRVSFEGSVVSAFSQDGTRLWTRDVNGRISSAEVEDLNVDGSSEVVVGTDTIVVFDRAGTRLWSEGDGMILRTVLAGHLLRSEPTLQVTALWVDKNGSKSSVSVYNASGKRLWAYRHHGSLDHVVIDQPTSRHGRKIIVTGVDDDAGSHFGIHQAMASMLVLGTNGKPVWRGVLFPPSERITRLEIGDHDKDSRSDIAVSTKAGHVLYVDFAGKVLGSSTPYLGLKTLPHHTRHE